MPAPIPVGQAFSRFCSGENAKVELSGAAQYLRVMPLDYSFPIAGNDVVLPFYASLAGRRIDVSQGGPHVVQRLAPVWRDVSSDLRRLVEFLHGASTLEQREKAEAAQLLRALAYSAAEVFEVYLNYLPQLLEKAGASSRVVRDYKGTVKRHKRMAALICNKCKHEGAQVGFVWAQALRNEESLRFVVCLPVNGDALELQKQVHERRHQSIDIVLQAHEILHALLRTDELASRFVSSTPEDANVPPVQNVPGGVGLAPHIRHLASMPVWVAVGESEMYDAIEVVGDTVFLRRGQALRLPSRGAMAAYFSADGVTRTFPVPFDVR